VTAAKLSNPELDHLKREAAFFKGSSPDKALGAGKMSPAFLRLLEASPGAIDDWGAERSYLPGDVVFDEGELGDALYLVLSGEVAVLESRFSDPRLLALRGPHEVIGEMALVEDVPRMASVIALEPTRLLRISRESYHELLGLNPEFGLEIMRVLSGRLREESRRPPEAGGFSRDPLTGAYARSTFDSLLLRLFDEAQRYGQCFSLLVVDLDHFKSVNDGFGHARGDEVLKEFSSRMRQAIRDCDYLFRYGGDEFCLLLPQTDGADAVALAHRLMAAVQDRPFEGRPPLSLSMSVGAASCSFATADTRSSQPPTPEALFELADRRAYEAKRLGRGRVVGEASATGAELGRDLVPAADICLIERDEALETLQRFFEDLPEKRRELLGVRGSAGSGRSCFLREAANRARLLNYAVLELSGSAPFSALALGSPSSSLFEFLASEIPRIVAEQGLCGLVITLDDAESSDAGTLRDLSLAMESGLAFPVGIVYADLERLAFEPGLMRRDIVLEPFSANAVQLWLRHYLHWEAPPELVEELRRKSGGLPEPLQRELASLILEGKLRSLGGAWSFEAGGRGADAT
jgi:diguanylate cyclase (GGDEF) domain